MNCSDVKCDGRILPRLPDLLRPVPHQGWVGAPSSPAHFHTVLTQMLYVREGFAG